MESKKTDGNWCHHGGLDRWEGWRRGMMGRMASWFEPATASGGDSEVDRCTMRYAISDVLDRILPKMKRWMRMRWDWSEPVGTLLRLVSVSYSTAEINYPLRTLHYGGKEYHTQRVMQVTSWWAIWIVKSLVIKELNTGINCPKTTVHHEWALHMARGILMGPFTTLLRSSPLPRVPCLPLTLCLYVHGSGYKNSNTLGMYAHSHCGPRGFIGDAEWRGQSMWWYL